MSNYETVNGKPKFKSSSTSKESINLKKKKSVTNEVTIINETNNNDEKYLDNDINIHKQYQNIFSCDHAQLPKESLIYENDVTNYSTKIQTNQKFYPNIFKAEIFDSQINNLLEENIENKLNSSVPNVILISTNSQNDIKNYSENLSLLGAPTEFNLYERPISRRGSRESTQEGGIEESEDNRSETPKPIGDQLEENRNLTTNGSKPRWSSESEDESGEIETYHPLESDDEQKTNLKNHNNNKLTNNVKSFNKRFPSFKSCDTSDTEDEVDVNSETNMLDRHNYQRLQESPLPPTNIEY